MGAVEKGVAVAAGAQSRAAPSCASCTGSSGLPVMSELLLVNGVQAVVCTGVEVEESCWSECEEEITVYERA